MKTHMGTEMDYLIMGDYLFAKEDQHVWQIDIDWKGEYPPDQAKNSRK